MTGIALIIGQGIVMNWYYWKKIELDIPRFWKEVGSVFCIPIIMCIIVKIIARYVNFYNLFILLIGIIIYTIIFVIINCLF